MTDELTRPEKFAAFGHARATVRRIIANGGACTICTHRSSYFGFSRCRGNPERMYPLCDKDGHAPTFELDETTLEGKIHG